MPQNSSKRAADERPGAAHEAPRGGLRRHLAYAVAGLRDRDVLKVAGLYSIALWAVFLAADVALPQLDFRDTLVRTVMLCGVAGLPVAILLAWFFRVGSGGIHLDAHQRPGQGDVPGWEAFVNVALVLASVLLVGLSLLMV